MTDIINLAEKKRHMLLLHKLNGDKGLTKKEIAELAKYEQQKNKAQKPQKKVVKKPVQKQEQKLTPKQERFCLEYVIDHNATEAAKRSGYSGKTAYSQGQRLLKNVEVIAKLAELEKQTADKVGVTAEMVLRELSLIAFNDIADLYDENSLLKSIHDIPKDARKVIAAIDVYEEFQGRGDDREMTGYTRKVKLNDKIKALELIGKHLSMFTDNVNLKVPNGCGVLMVPAGMSEDAWLKMAQQPQNKDGNG